jgi:hypothetical protein
MWLRQVLAWVLSVVVLTAVLSLILDKEFTRAGLMTVGLISLAVLVLFTIGDRLWRHVVDDRDLR